MAQGVPYNVFSGPGTISHANCIQFPHLAVADLRFTPWSCGVVEWYWSVSGLGDHFLILGAVVFD